jgi:hypothetical protein
MKVTLRSAVIIAGFISSGLLVFEAGCSLDKRTEYESDAEQVEAVSVEATTAEEGNEEQATEVTFTANQFCAACHYGFVDEELARTHEKAGIGCERCHGESEPHRSDENNITPPDIMYPKDKINPTCMMCHPRHEIKHVAAHTPLLSGAKTIFDSDQSDGGKLCCTTCHAEEHRINVRTIRWNKATGELLNE